MQTQTLVKETTGKDCNVKEIVLKDLEKTELILLHTKYTSMIQGVRIAMSETNDRAEHKRLAIIRSKFARNVQKIDGELSRRKMIESRNYEQKFIINARRTLPVEVFNKIHTKALEGSKLS